MQAIREYKKVQNNQLVIDLPENFKAKEVEVIILAIDAEKKEEQKESLSEFLLKGPSLNKEELEDIENIREWYKEWEILQF